MAVFAAFACMSSLWLGETHERFHFEDVERFVRVAASGPIEASLYRSYLQSGSHAVRIFTPLRIVDAEALAQAVRRRPESYRGLDRKAEAIRRQIPAMVQVMWNLQRRYSAARFPEVWFVVGRGNTAGLANVEGMILAIEHEATNPDAIVPLFAHELIHYQQKSRPRTLLDHSIHEGAADFLGEMICGRMTPHAAETKRIAESRSVFIWDEFWKDARANANHARWLFNSGSGTKDWPSDLGYWIGYGLAAAHFRRAVDQNRAFVQILEMADYRLLSERSQ